MRGVSYEQCLLTYFIFTYSTEILFSKQRSAGLNYHLPKLSGGWGYCLTVSNIEIMKNIVSQMYPDLSKYLELYIFKNNTGLDK